MRRATNTLFVILALLQPVSVFAASHFQPKGFRGVKWGTALNGLSDMSLFSDKPSQQTYKRSSDKLSIGNASLKAITYMAYKHKLMGVVIVCNGHTNFRRLKETLKEAYGQPTKSEKQNSYTWKWPNLLLTLRYNVIAKEGTIMYLSLPIMAASERDINREVKKGVADL